MNKLPFDISTKIEQDYTMLVDKEIVTAQLLSLWTTNINVGADQLARCILFLSDGEIETFKKIFSTNFYGDPRDLILIAMEKSGHKINWGIDKLNTK